MQRFNPKKNGTLAYTANGVSQNFALPGGGGLLLRIQNSGANIAYGQLCNDANVSVSIPSSTAGGGFPIFANQPPIQVTMAAGDTRIALISAGNSTVQVTRGDAI